MKSTDELLEQLKNLDMEQFITTDDFEDISVSEYLNMLLEKKNLQAKDVIVKLNMERSYTYQILKGRRKPTRNFLIRIALLCKLSLEETQRLLTIAKRPILYPRNRFDAAVIYCIQHKLSEDNLSELLIDIGEEDLINGNPNS